MTTTSCPDCGTAVAAADLSCAGCGWLRHTAALEQLAMSAKQAEQAGDVNAARTYWQQALALLPVNTVQYKAIDSRIATLAPKPAGWKKGAVGVGPALLLLLGKGKLLLLGLTKLSTLISMFAFFGVYWTLYGWAFALGFVLAIYIHEMGHVILLRRYGIPASAPLFIPGLGAMIGVPGTILDPVADSRVGLAGPIYGFSAALAACAAGRFSGNATLSAIGYSTAVINLFNLIPVWQLDGSRGLHSLTRAQRAMLLAISIAMLIVSGERMLFLVAAGLVYRLFTKDQSETPDHIGLMQFAFLLLSLPALAMVSAVAHAH